MYIKFIEAYSLLRYVIEHWLWTNLGYSIYLNALSLACSKTGDFNLGGGSFEALPPTCNISLCLSVGR